MAADAEEDQKSRTLQVSSTGFCYSHISPTDNNNHHQHLMNQIQTSSYESNPSEMFNLTTGMEIIGYFTSNKQGNNGGGGGGGPSFSSLSKQQQPAPVDNSFYSHEFIKPDFPTVVVTSGSHLIGIPPEPVSSSWQDDDDNNNNNRMLVDDSSLRCVFSCEGNERPSQGLSLTLSSTNPSTIGLQSFERRQHQQQHPNATTADDLRYISSTTSSREGYFGKASATTSVHTVQPQQQQMMMQAGGLFQGKVLNLHPQHHHQQFHLRNSKYLGPAQELLNEFCSLGTKQNNNEHHPPPQKQKIVHKFNDWEGDHHQGISGNNNGASSSSSNNNKHLYTLELMELQKRKAKLLSMLDEVDRRYKHYCDQMKAVVSSFEEVAGNGAAKVYSALASKAMSRHFRCLRDGIVGQIQATRKAMGEKDEPIAPGTTRGETPRLRLLDQTLRQQRAFQQMNMMENHPWRPQRGLPERSVSVLRAWLFEHFLHPYPSDVDKHILARQTGLSRSQVSNWFINARVRLWKPMVEEMYLEETKEELQDNTIATNNNNMTSSDGSIIPNHHQDAQTLPVSDQKPTQEQLVRIDSECLSSIINNNRPEKVDHQANKDTSKGHQSYNIHPQHQQQQQGGFGAYGAMELDFSSYNQNAHQEFGGVSRGGGVSLTLGLQQHGGAGGVSLAISPTSQSSLFYAREHIEDNCQPVQYSILDGDQGQNNLPYRNLLGAQLLHDLAG